MNRERDLGTAHVVDDDVIVIVHVTISTFMFQKASLLITYNEGDPVLPNCFLYILLIDRLGLIDFRRR